MEDEGSYCAIEGLSTPAIYRMGPASPQQESGCFDSSICGSPGRPSRCPHDARFNIKKLLWYKVLGDALNVSDKVQVRQRFLEARQILKTKLHST